MKKLNLLALEFGASEVLTREQVKNVRGGVAATPTCMQSTKSFGACMNCAIKECTDDWACAIGCAVEAAGCAVVFAASCGIAQL